MVPYPRSALFWKLVALRSKGVTGNRKPSSQLLWKAGVLKHLGGTTLCPSQTQHKGEPRGLAEPPPTPSRLSMPHITLGLGAPLSHKGPWKSKQGCGEDPTDTCTPRSSLLRTEGLGRLQQEHRLHLPARRPQSSSSSSPGLGKNNQKRVSPAPPQWAQEPVTPTIPVGIHPQPGHQPRPPGAARDSRSGHSTDSSLPSRQAPRGGQPLQGTSSHVNKTPLKAVMRV